MRYMLDTNICIYLIKRHPPQVFAKLEALRLGEVAMSVVTYAELRAGLEMKSLQRAQDEQVLRLLTTKIPVIPFDSEAAVSYGKLRAAVLERKRDALDRMIASHALSLGLILVTNNEADFLVYPGLQVENWVS